MISTAPVSHGPLWLCDCAIVPPVPHLPSSLCLLMVFCIGHVWFLVFSCVPIMTFDYSGYSCCLLFIFLWNCFSVWWCLYCVPVCFLAGSDRSYPLTFAPVSVSIYPPILKRHCLIRELYQMCENVFIQWKKENISKDLFLSLLCKERRWKQFLLTVAAQVALYDSADLWLLRNGAPSVWLEVWVLGVYPLPVRPLHVKRFLKSWDKWK